MTEKRHFAEEILSMLPSTDERAAIYRRYLLCESPAEIALALQQRSITKGITKKDVYRLVERGLRRLSKNPRVQQLAPK